jgi:hypothetical protein
MHLSHRHFCKFTKLSSGIVITVNPIPSVLNPSVTLSPLSLLPCCYVPALLQQFHCRIILLFQQKCPVQKDNNPPTCAVCAERHATELHACTICNCKQGILCTHHPIKCINCDSPHKATKLECPTRIKIQTKLKTKWQTAEPPQGLGGTA